MELESKPELYEHFKRPSENLSCKQSHKLDEIRVERISMFQFVPIAFTSLLVLIQWLLDYWNQKQEQENQPFTRIRIGNCD